LKSTSHEFYIGDWRLLSAQNNHFASRNRVLQRTPKHLTTLFGDKDGKVTILDLELLAGDDDSNASDADFGHERNTSKSLTKG
jgi:hypothetical protein